MGRKYYKRRRKKRNTRIMKLTKTIGGFPMNVKVNLRYAQEIYLHASATTAPYVDFRVFSCNNIYSPYQTAGQGQGHKPANMPVWFDRFKKVTVIASKLSMRNINAITTTNSCIGGVLLSKSDLAVYNIYRAVGYDGILEQPGSGLRNVSYGTRTGAALQPAQLSSFSASRTFGRSTKAILNSKDFSHTDSTGPVEQAYWHIWNAPVDSTPPGRNVYIIEITYTCVFAEAHDSEVVA